MRQIVRFLIRNKNFLLYLVFFSFALILTLRSRSYHQSKFVKSANWISGSIYSLRSDVNSYLSLKDENFRLASENANLRMLLFNMGADTVQAIDDISITDSLKYDIIPSRIIKNSYGSANNYLTLDKGEKDGVKQDMGVITSKGIVGIIEHTSSQYATVLSILSGRSGINAKLKNTNYFGGLVWDGKNSEEVLLTDIRRLVTLHVGDTIITGGNSAIFPEGVPIGSISRFEPDPATNYYNITVQLFNDMTNLGYVYIINNFDAEEQRTLEQKNRIDE